MNPAFPAGTMRWMTRAEAAEHLRISPRQLNRMKLPRSYAAGNRSPRFLQADLDAAMTAAATTPNANVIAFPTGPRRPAKALRPAVGAIIATDRREWLRAMRRSLAA